MHRIFALFLFVFSFYAQFEYLLKPEERILKAREKAYRWTNDYVWVLDGDLVIEKGAKLIVAPGTKIKFVPNTDQENYGKDPNRSEVIVRGQLIAVGQAAPDQRITFTSAAKGQTQKSGDWYGLVIYKNRNGLESRISNCNIEFGFRGITVLGSSPSVKESQILYSFNTGIYISAKSKSKIESNIIQNNDYAGIEVILRSTPIISKNTITQNEYGVMIYDSSNPDLGKNAKDSPNSGKNKIANNFKYDLYNHSSANVVAENNNWSSPKLSEIYKSIYDRRSNSSYGFVDIEPISQAAAVNIQKENIQRRSIAKVRKPKAKKKKKIRSKKTKKKKNRVPKSQPVLAKKKTEETTSKKAEQIKDNKTETKQNAVAKDDLQSDTETTEEESDKNEVETIQVEEEVSTEPMEDEVGEYTKASMTDPYIGSILDVGTGVEINQILPSYTGAAKEQGIKGKVIVLLIIGLDGKVESAQVLKSDHVLLEDLAIEAAKRFRYSQGLIQGQPVRFNKTQVFRF
jgi:TonB family protein